MASPHPTRPGDRAVVLVAHHTPDLYGSDLQLLESVEGMVAAGYAVVVTVPHDGPLVPLLRERGAEVELLRAPVIRKSFLHPVGLLRLAYAGVRDLPGAVRLLRRHHARVLYVNTVILPFWLVAARVARVRSLCHVHEAPAAGHWALRAALVLPLLLADRVVVNSEASRQALAGVSRRVSRRAAVVHNGVPGPPEPPTAPDRHGPARLVLVGRLSPNKGIDVALNAVAELLRRGEQVSLTVAGTVFPGYEAYEEELRERAARPDLAGSVELAGYVSPTWPVLASARVVLVPSRTEPFGNTAVEGQFARRPVVASRVQGLPEIVSDGETGLLVAPEDPIALADAVQRLLRDADEADRLAEAGQEQAKRRFGVGTYQSSINGHIAEIAWNSH